MRLNRKYLFMGLTIAVIAIGVSAWMAHSNVARLIEADDWVAHTTQVIAKINRLEKYALDLETGAHGYVITGEPVSLQPYEDARSRILAVLDSVGDLTKDNPAQQTNLATLKQVVQQKLDHQQHVVAVFKQDGQPAAIKLIADGEGKRLMDAIRRQVDTMRGIEESLLDQRRNESTAASESAQQVSFIASWIGIGLVAACSVMLFREFLRRVRAEALIRLKEEEARITLQSIGDGVITTDSNGRITRLNAIAETLTGWTTADALGKPVAEVFRIINERTRQTVECPVARVLRNGTVVGLANHTLLIRKDGSEVPIADSGAPIRATVEHDIRGVVLVFRDQSAERAGEAKLRQHAEEIEDLYNHAPCGYHSLDNNGVFVRINDTELTWLGRTRFEVVGKMKFSDVITPESQAVFRGTFANYKEHGLAKDVRYDLLRKDGSTMPMLLNATAVRDASGNITASRATMIDWTDVRQSQEQLEQQARLLDLSADAIMALDLNGMIRFWNRGAVALYGWQKEEAVGRLGYELLNTQFPEPLATIEARVVQSGHWEGELVHLTRDGRRITVSSRWSLDRDAQGRPVRILETNSDVTERKRAEAERDRFFTLSLELLCIADFSGKFRRLNPAFERVLGYSMDELLRTPFLQLIHPDDREATKAETEKLYSGAMTQQFENRYRCKDGSWRWFSWVAVADLKEGLIYACARDVTEQKRAEEKQRQLLAILDATPDYMAISRLDGQRIYINPAGRRMIGMDETEDVTQTRIPDFYSPESARVILEEGIPSAARNGVWFGETHLRARDGHDIPVSQILLAHKNSRGEVDHVSTIARDISLQKGAEAALIHAKNAAEAATAAKSQFLANMSHELRTPLNAILGFSEILEDQNFGTLNPKQARYVSNILNSGRHLLQLINDILDLAKVEAGRIELAPEPFDPAKSVQDVLAVVKALAGKKGITLVNEAPDGLPALNADPAKFKQILYNLLSNAVKFTHDSGTVTINAQVTEIESTPPATDPPKPALRITVSDTGIGIKPADQQRIWKEFEQIDSTYARQQQGTGLGLTLTRKLVEMHGGRIRVQSDGIEGKGATFTFEMPLAGPPRAEGDDLADATGRMAFIRSTPGRPLVLVVEDDTQAAGLLDHYLLTSGYDVAHARDGHQALRLAAELKPFAITLDILLPGKTGWEVLAELKSNRDTREIPVVIVSVTDDRQLGFSLGAVEFLVKPVPRDLLIESIRNAGTMAGRTINSVMIVDDEPHAVESLGKAVRTAGFHVSEAASGRQALELAREQPPDLMILDLMMPGMTGFEALDRLRANPLTARMPVLIHTAKDLTLDERQRLQILAQGITQKSASKELLAELRRLATKRPPAPANRDFLNAENHETT